MIDKYYRIYYQLPSPFHFTVSLFQCSQELRQTAWTKDFIHNGYRKAAMQCMG